MHVRGLQGEIKQMEGKNKITDDALQEANNEIFRYTKEYEETPFVSHGTQTNPPVESRDNFSQMINNKPLP